jgi:hypothetical protein
LSEALSISLVATLEPATVVRSPYGMALRGNQPTAQSVAAGQHLSVDLHVANQGSQAVEIRAAELKPASGDWATSVKSAAPATLDAGQAFDAQVAATVPTDVEPTQPYFSRPNLEQSYYDLRHPEDLGLPTAPYPLSAHLAYSYQGADGSVDVVVQTVHRVNVLGPVLEPLLVAPAVSVSITPDKGIIPLGSDHLDLDVLVRNNTEAHAEGAVALKLPQGWTVEPATASFTLAHDGEERPVHFRVVPRGMAESTYTVTAVATVAGKEFAESFTTIGYPGLRPYPEARPSTFTAAGVDVKIAPGLRVGYVMGPGDDVPAAMAQLGVEPVQLTAHDLAAGNLSAYNAIVVGIRAYTTRADLRANNGRLLEYVKNGGVVVVEYQTVEFDHNYGPFALSVPGDAEKVVEEDGPVSFDAADPLLSWPNRIRDADFNNWVEERGHGFASSWAADFHAPTSMHDADQDPQKGGLLWAHSGKGLYIYTSYAFFRELPEGVPGAFRIMANLLSAGSNVALAGKP